MKKLLLAIIILISISSCQKTETKKNNSKITGKISVRVVKHTKDDIQSPSKIIIVN